MIIPYGRQDITQADIDAVVDVLNSDFLTQGPQTLLFEKAISSYSKSKYAIAVNSATSALHIACLALDLGPGDWLWTTPITFVASANCGLYCGAKVDFVDIDPLTYNLSPQALENKLIKAKKVGKLPKIVIPVHLSGQSCDMEAIYNLGKKYGFKIIEDASHAIGGRYQDQPIGNCKYSDITIFSFHPVKIITTAEGGAALTNDVDLAERMMLLRSHGITRDPDRMTKTPDGPWYYQQIDLGFNYRMSDLQAALGVSQLERLDKYIAKRHLIAEYYDTAFSKLPVTLPSRGKDCHSSCHLYILKIKMEDLKVSRYQIFKMLRKRGIGVNLHYIPIHMQPYYQAMGFKVGDFPESEKYYESAISIPLHPGLSQKMQEHITLCLSDILNAE